MIRSGFVLICFGMWFSSRAGEPAKLDMTKEEQKLVELTNAERKKKDLPALDRVRYERWTEGRCAQVLHVGPYADEGPSIVRLHEAVESLRVVGPPRLPHKFGLREPLADERVAHAAGELAVLEVGPHMRRVQPGRHVPVDVANVVAGLVLAQVAEVGALPSDQRSVVALEPAIEPADHPPLEPAQDPVGGQRGRGAHCA